MDETLPNKDKDFSKNNSYIEMNNNNPIKENSDFLKKNESIKNEKNSQISSKNKISNTESIEYKLKNSDIKSSWKEANWTDIGEKNLNSVTIHASNVKKDKPDLSNLIENNDNSLIIKKNNSKGNILDESMPLQEGESQYLCSQRLNISQNQKNKKDFNNSSEKVKESRINTSR